MNVKQLLNVTHTTGSKLITLLLLVFGAWVLGGSIVMAQSESSVSGVLLGGALGALTFLATGGVGVAALGGAVGLGAGGFTAIGAYLGYEFLSQRRYEVWEWLPICLMGASILLIALFRAWKHTLNWLKLRRAERVQH
ncbi:hypothetical protein GCM10025772_18020 [Ferrimonas gelatinilytica]|uniref:Uncharacterized protein n=1 Tax=Ferrimonas gelatinilytica TaxID=1255257 RepID=A0ABP9S7B6_9GAMM